MIANRTNRTGESGFALLTVIVIIMALTILGLSLFNLSGFEARFFSPTVDAAQATQSMRGGVEWARFVLETTDSLDLVRTAARPPGVTGVLARREKFPGDTFEDADSTGSAFVPPYYPIWVRVVGDQGDQSGAVLAKFQPSAGVDLYKRLITVVDRLEINNENPPQRFNNTELYGRILAPQVVDYLGNDPPGPVPGANCIQNSWVPHPSLDLAANAAWWQQKFALAQNLTTAGGTINLGNDATPTFYRSDAHLPFGNRYWSANLTNGSVNTIRARGISVWMLPEGLRSLDQLRFEKAGGAPATVILVTRFGDLEPGQTTTEEPEMGLALIGGVWIEDGVNVFMISTGTVEIEHWQTHDTDDGYAGYLSIYANRARLMGPKSNGHEMKLFHGTSCGNVPPQDAKNGLVDQLIQEDLLPNSKLARKRLQLVAGTWEERSATVGN